jgi:aminoglycoside phosphotransferase (APT) family kinase protein
MPPPEVPVTDDVLREIAARHGVVADRFERLPSLGVINVVYALGDDHVVRVPRDDPIHLRQAATEAATIPSVVGVGVRTPALVAYDDACDLLPVPYLVVERVHGRDLESRGVDPVDVPDVLREVGADLARVHALGARSAPSGVPTTDLPALLDELVTLGWLSRYETGWLQSWLEELETLPAPPTLVHGDIQLSNILVDDDLRYVALLDWGCAFSGDPAIDFMPVPMRAVPPMLEGYRAAGGDVDARRILRGGLIVLLRELHRGAEPGTSWGERPVAWLADLAGFLGGGSIADTWSQRLR